MSDSDSETKTHAVQRLQNLIYEIMEIKYESEGTTSFNQKISVMIEPFERCISEINQNFPANSFIPPIQSCHNLLKTQGSIALTQFMLSRLREIADALDVNINNSWNLPNKKPSLSLFTNNLIQQTTVQSITYENATGDIKNLPISESDQNDIIDIINQMRDESSKNVHDKQKLLSFVTDVAKISSHAVPTLIQFGQSLGLF